MNQPPPPIGFGTPDSDDSPYEQPVVSNEKAAQMAILGTEARMRRERNEAEHEQELERGKQADRDRQLILGTIIGDAETAKAAEEVKRVQERARRDADRMKQKMEREKDRQEVAQALERIKENGKMEKDASEKNFAYNETNSRQRINAQRQETERLVAQHEATNAENRRKAVAERAVGQAQHDREMEERQRALDEIRKRKEDCRRKMMELELEGMGPVPTINLPIGPPPPVPFTSLFPTNPAPLPNAFLTNIAPQSAIAPPPPPVSSQIHTQTQYSTPTVVNEVNEVKTAPQTEPAMNQQQPEETRPASSSGNIKGIMGAIDEIDEMLRKKCKAALEYISKYYASSGDRVSMNSSVKSLKLIIEGTVAFIDKLSELKLIIGELKIIEAMSTDVKYFYADSTAMFNQLPNCSSLDPEERTKLLKDLDKSFGFYCETFDEFKSSMQQIDN